ncbi:MAG TPA: hypothetical protein VL134_05875 [Leptolyngbya sp.]|nr:hypothetical protein [Leptolyngbya sp.]
MLENRSMFVFDRRTHSNHSLWFYLTLKQSGFLAGLAIDTL